MTRHAIREANRFGGGADEAVGVDAADGLAGALVHDEERAGFGGESVDGQCGFDLCVERDDFDFLGFFLGDGHAVTDALMFKIVHILPAEAQKVADAERGIDAHDDEDVVAELAALEIIRRKFADLVLVTNGFCGFHTGILRRT